MHSVKRLVWIPLLIGLVFVALQSNVASAGEPGESTWAKYLPKYLCVCPDGCKPAPKIPCPPCDCLCDDYCRKPMPKVCPEPDCCKCDDYCRKPQPCPGALPCLGPCHPVVQRLSRGGR